MPNYLIYLLVLMVVYFVFLMTWIIYDFVKQVKKDFKEEAEREKQKKYEPIRNSIVTIGNKLILIYHKESSWEATNSRYFDYILIKKSLLVDELDLSYLHGHLKPGGEIIYFR